MSNQSHVSLLDLSKQFPFEIDDTIKKNLCFDETLIISCGHCEGDIDNESSESEWSCTESSASEVVEVKDVCLEIKDKVDEESHQEVVEDEEHDFHFYFFPDCSKPLVQDSKASLVIVDGMPKINQATKINAECTCEIDKTNKCPCHIRLPCRCGARTVNECTCLNIENICICDESKPQIVCTCKPSNVCVCRPDCGPRPICTCAQVDKPCICQPGKFPCPICICECKPKFDVDNSSKRCDEFGEEAVSEAQTIATKTSVVTEKEPCTCQVPIPRPICFCMKDKECVCKEDQCICDIQPTCTCEPDEDKKLLCKDDDSKTICDCPKTECTCFANSPSECKCFPKPMLCTCGNPNDCKCFSICDCIEPCICDTAPKEEPVCTCPENTKAIAGGKVCTCPPKKEDIRKLKKTRAGKHGYRWCHDVDPRHTYFDYAYGRHDKISYKEQEKEKLKILGLNDEEPTVAETSEAHEVIKAPEFTKKYRKPSLDCCSAVGGISISVETLGDDDDKFLVQVVSHASKEGAKTGTKLVSILDCNLHTLEENRTEHITKKDITKERRSYMTICDSGYYNKVTRICGERNFVKRIYHSFEDAHNFLLEGANVVLLRYFGLTRYRGTIKTDTILMDGMICESVYVSLGVSQAIVNAKPLFVVKVERHIIEPSGFIHQTLTALTLRVEAWSTILGASTWVTHHPLTEDCRKILILYFVSYIVSHEWADNSYIFHINPLLRVTPERDEIEPHEPLREKWRDDLQLFSDYLDFKSVRSSEGARYVTENGELTGTIRDYLQTLLLLRPHDALHFTRHYFGSALSALDLPHNEFFDPCSKHVRYYFFEE